MSQTSINDADALLLYRVGPVYCCSPTFPVESVVLPPHMTQTPGSSVAEPGLFKTAYGIVKAIDLRKRFGVEKSDWVSPGRIVIIEVEGGHAGMWVDEIVDVIQSPSKGWGDVPAIIPRDVFSKTLVFNDVIQLYADFEKIYSFKEVGYLRQHIANLKANEIARKEEEIEKIKREEVKQGPVVLPEKSTNASNENINKDVAQSDNKVDEANTKPGSAGFDEKTEINTRSESAHIKPDVMVRESNNDSYQQKQSSKTVNVSSSLHSNKKHSDDATKPSVRRTEVFSSDGKRQSSIKERPEFKRTVKGGSVHEAPAREARFREDKPRKEEEGASPFWYILVVVLLLVLGSYAIVVQLPSDDMDSMPVVDTNKNIMKPENSLVNKKDIIEDKVIESQQEKDAPIAIVETEPEITGSVEEIKNEKPLTEVLNDKDIPAEDKDEEFHAEIKKDDEGIVIVLNQSYIETSALEARAAEEKETSLEEKNTQEDGSDQINERLLESQKNKDEEIKKLDAEEGIAKSEVLSEPEVKVEINNQLDLEVEKVVDKISMPIIKKEEHKIIIHIVVKGDTLWHIAKRYINNPYRYPELAKLSHIKNPDLIYPGNKVKIIFTSKFTGKKR